MKKGDFAFYVTMLAIVIVLGLIAACTPGCSTNTNTVIARPGVPLLVLKPFTAPAGSTATEVAKGKYVPNQGKTDIPVGAVIVVLPATVSAK